MENNFKVLSGQDKYESSLEVMKEFGGYDALKKAVAEKMKAAKSENIQIGSEDFIKFVLGYIGEDIKKDSVREIMKANIKGMVDKIEEEKKFGIEISDNCDFSGLNDCGKEKKTKPLRPEKENENDPSKSMTDYEYFLFFGKRRKEE